MKTFCLIAFLCVCTNSYGIDSDQWYIHKGLAPSLLKKLNDDCYAGLECVLTIFEYSLSSSLSDYKQYIDEKNKNVTKVEMSICQPNEKDWLVSNFKKMFDNIMQALSYNQVFILERIGIVLLIIYAKNPYGDGVSLYSMIISSTCLEDFLNKLWSMPVPSFSHAVRGGVYEEIIFRFIIQHGLYYVFKNGLTYFYSDEELIENHSNLLSLSIASFSFGLAHLHNPNPQIAQVLFATLAGLYLGIVYINNGIISSSICHSTFNGCALLARTALLYLLFIIPKVVNWYSNHSLP